MISRPSGRFKQIIVCPCPYTSIAAHQRGVGYEMRPIIRLRRIFYFDQGEVVSPRIIGTDTCDHNEMAATSTPTNSRRDGNSIIDLGANALKRQCALGEVD